MRVVVEDFGGGCVITTELLPGETEKDAKRRYARKRLDDQRYREALRKWEPGKQRRR